MPDGDRGRGPRGLARAGKVALITILMPIILIIIIIVIGIVLVTVIVVVATTIIISVIIIIIMSPSRSTAFDAASSWAALITRLTLLEVRGHRGFVMKLLA